MNQEDKKLITGVKQKVVNWMTGLALTSIVVAVGFYFNTNYVMAQNTADIKMLKADTRQIRSDVAKIKTVPLINQSQIKDIKKDVSRIEKSIDKIDEKTDEIMQLLFQIKQRQSQD